MCISGGKKVPGKTDKCKGPEVGGNVVSDNLNPCGLLYKLSLRVMWQPLGRFEEWGCV